MHVVLFSGGFDSTVLLLSLLYDKKIPPSEIIALNIYYGQRNVPEIIRSIEVCEKFNITRDEIDISNIANKIFEISALVNKNIDVDQDVEKYKQPNTYVPNRNMIFISIAAAYAETIGAHDIYIALQPHHKYYYWDITSTFVKTINSVLEFNPANIKLHAPFINMQKKEIYEYAKSIGIDNEILKKAWSCYNPVTEVDLERRIVVFKPCGKCGTCQERNDFLPQDELEVSLKKIRELGF